MRVQSLKMRVFSLAIAVSSRLSHMKFPTSFIYRNLHGFAQFPGDSTAFVAHSCTVCGWLSVLCWRAGAVRDELMSSCISLPVTDNTR